MSPKGNPKAQGPVKILDGSKRGDLSASALLLRSGQHVQIEGDKPGQFDDYTVVGVGQDFGQTWVSIKSFDGRDTQRVGPGRLFLPKGTKTVPDLDPETLDALAVAGQHELDSDFGWVHTFERCRDIRLAAKKMLKHKPFDPGLDIAGRSAKRGSPWERDNTATALGMLLNLHRATPQKVELHRAVAVDPDQFADVVHDLGRGKSFDLSLASFGDRTVVRALFRQHFVSPETRDWPTVVIHTQGAVKAIKRSKAYDHLSLYNFREYVSGGRFTVQRTQRSGKTLEVWVEQDETFDPLSKMQTKALFAGDFVDNRIDGLFDGNLNPEGQMGESKGWGDYDTEYETKREFSVARRHAMSRQGTAMPDGSFPIATLEDLKNAIQAVGRAKNPDAAKAHIKKRAAALGHSDLVPNDW